MIVVIADDLTGATEIGGIGLRYNLKVEITNQINSPIEQGTELFIVNADTRSMPFEAAMEHLREMLNWIRQLHYSHLFKKIDSVLRGHVLTEINMQLAAMKAKRALLIPANPRLGRTIRDGKYYVHDQLIHKTDFYHDPEFPVKDADVLNMLQSKGEVNVLTWEEKFPKTGIVLGETNTETDVKKWIKKKPEGTMLAGASSCFHVFLQHILKVDPKEKWGEEASFYNLKKISLYVCGSNFEASVQRVKDWQSKLEPVFYIPVKRFDGIAFKQWLLPWVKMVAAAISSQKKAIIAFENHADVAEKPTAAHLRQMMANAVKSVVSEIAIEELIIEGGATAGAVLEQLQVSKLIPQEELAPGVIRCSTQKDPKIWITLKPGSYDWNIMMD